MIKLHRAIGGRSFLTSCEPGQFSFRFCYMFHRELLGGWNCLVPPPYLLQPTHHRESLYVCIYFRIKTLVS
jgi:hypothetical protein